MTLLRYRPVRRLASGPTTESFLAQQIGIAGLERLVVLQRLRRELVSDAHYVQLFLEGTRQAGQLRHPNVVETLEVGQEGDVFFLITEYLSAEELLHVTRHARKHERPIPIAIACQIVHDVASALAYAHEATDLDGQPLGIVHGEVSPRQIFVSYDGIAKLDGFGLAKANTHHVYARPDDMRIKLAYGAPERVRYEELTPATDVFSLAVVFHELLTGERLFRGKTPADVIKAAMEQTILPPSQVSKRAPKELDAVIMRALERDVAARTPTAEAFINDLRLATSSLGVVAGSDDVGDWMRTELAGPHQRRLTAEGQVAREVSDIEPDATGEIEPLFSSPGSIGAFADIGSTGMGSVPSGLIVQEQRKSMLPWLVVGVVALLVVLGSAFYLGTFGPGAESAARPASPAAPGVVIFTSPTGTTVQIDGALVAQDVGDDGVFIARGEADVVTVEVALPGFETIRQTIQMPVEGRRELRLTLEELSDELMAEAPSDPPAVDDSEPSSPATTSGPRRFAGRASAMARRETGSSPTPSRSGRLLIHFLPASASIAVDGVTVAGRSPLEVSDLAPGTHTVRASAAGYSTTTREATVQADGSQTVRIELAPGAPRTASLDIVTSPSGADVLVDGRSRGTSPLRGLELQPDREYRISLRLAGHQAWSARVTPVAGRNPPLMASLQATPQVVASAPAAAPAAATRSDIRVPSSMLGNAASGQRLLASGCGQCHGRTAGALNARRYTQAQWTRYFATGRHGRRAMLGESFSRGQLADVKSYLLANAADVQSDRAAGVR